MLTVIIPAYNEEKNILLSHDIISEILQNANIEYELIFVNDGSKDNSWFNIQKLSKIDLHVRGINFSRNFGKEAAIMAGFAQTKGDCCVVIDCDLQHPPQMILDMYHLWEQGYEVVEGVKASRGKENFLHRIFAKAFYRMISNATGIEMSGASDFKLIDYKVVKCLLNMPEKARFFRALSSWVGFKSTQVIFNVQERVEGYSKWSLKSLIKYAINNITSFSSLPMQLVSITGIIYFVFALILLVQTLFRYFSGNAVEGFSTIIILILFTGSSIMISLGLIGYYIAKIYDEVKDRPLYIISEII